MAETAVSGSIELLRRIGFFDVILPTILVYTIIFGILQRTKIFGTLKEGKTGASPREIDSVVAFSIALLLVGAGNLTGIMNAFIPYVGLLSVLIVSFMMIASFVVGDIDEMMKQKGIKSTLLVISMIAFIWVFGFVAGWWDVSIIRPNDINKILSNDTTSTIIFLAIMGGIIYWIMGSSPKKEGKK